MSASRHITHNVEVALRALKPLHRWNEQLRTWSSPVNHLIVQAAQLDSGMRVLDLATGTGSLVFDLSEALGQKGHVVGIDLAHEFLASAYQHALRRDVCNVDFQQANAEDLPFADRSFDVVTCMFGVMYFRDVNRALRECRRVLKIGGRIVLLVWGPKENNPIYASTIGIISKFAQVSKTAEGMPDPYRFSERGMLSSALEQSGFRCLREENIKTHLRWSGTIEELWQFLQESNAYLRFLLHSLSAEVQEEVRSEVFSSLQKYKRDESVELAVEVLLSEGELTHAL